MQFMFLVQYSARKVFISNVGYPNLSEILRVPTRDEALMMEAASTSETSANF
jgi:hypothetical protein